MIKQEKKKKNLKGYLTDLLRVLKYKAQDYIKKKKNQSNTKNLSLKKYITLTAELNWMV